MRLCSQITATVGENAERKTCHGTLEPVSVSNVRGRFFQDLTLRVSARADSQEVNAERCVRCGNVTLWANP